jgi:hypothetical protein
MPIDVGGRQLGLTGAHYYAQATYQGIVLDSLYAYYDASIGSSYPGSGSTWFDISGNGRHLSMGSGATLTNQFGGVIQFTKDANGFARIAGSSFDLRSVNHTVLGWVRKLSNGDDGRTITALDNNWLLAHHDNTYGDYYAEGWVNDISSPTSDTTWRMFTGTGNVSTDTWGIYINDSLAASNSNGSQGPHGLNINNQYSQYSSCQIGCVIAYTRVLTAAEVLQNYNALRKRFGV